MNHRIADLVLCAALIIPAAHAPAMAAANAPPAADVVLTSLTKELERSFGGLRKSMPELYFLGYEAEDVQEYFLSAALGASAFENESHSRQLTVDARLGEPRLDNTHQLKGAGEGAGVDTGGAAALPAEDDESALRAAAWLQTDKAVKAAREQLTRVLTNKAVTAEEEDKSADFSFEPKARAYAPAPPIRLDKDAWRTRLRRLSAPFKKHRFIIDTGVQLRAERVNRYLVSSEGSSIVTGNRYVRLAYYLTARTTDGMDLSRSMNYDADSPEGLPDDAVVLRDMERSADELRALTVAPLVEPFTGPAIFRARAAAVYFHEIMGHRVEGHRQKLEKEGQTFTKKLGQPVTAPFINVDDDPTVGSFHGVFLRGAYRFDDEGVPSRRAEIVSHGVLKGFLMSRSPVKGFSASNGHGRREAGYPVVSRMGNTIVSASRSVPYRRLRELLIEEIRRQGKPYGLVFDDISGGFTTTGRESAQSFKVIPLLVYRVYPDGRPDEVVRGVDIVGTPLASFTKIAAAADDDEVFNGTCGAESGGVPVSAIAPSILMTEVEVEKKMTSSEKPPILPPPHFDR